MTTPEYLFTSNETPAYSFHDVFTLVKKEFPVDLLNQLTALVGHERPKNIYGLPEGLPDKERRAWLEQIPADAFEKAIAHEYTTHMRALQDAQVPEGDLPLLVNYINNELEKAAQKIERGVLREQFFAQNGAASNHAMYDDEESTRMYQQLKSKRLVIDEKGHLRVIPVVILNESAV